jgi:hypothetical protein
MLWLKNMILQRDYKIDMIMREEKKKKKTFDAQWSYDYNITNIIKNISTKGI